MGNCRYYTARAKYLLPLLHKSPSDLPVVITFIQKSPVVLTSKWLFNCGS